MNRIRSAVVGGVLGVVCALGAVPVASAGQPGDYAYRWPLKTDGDSAAWQFALTPEVYAALADAGLRDFEVFNAEGQPVPVARLTVDPAATPGVAQVSLPAYALPRAADATATPDDLALRIERDTEGRLRVLQVEAGADPAQLAIDYIIDADMRRDSKRPSSVDRLDFSWPERGDVRARFVLEGSEDLVYWQTVVPEVAVVSLRRGDAVLQRRDVEFPPSALRYLRLRQIDGTPVPGLQVTARRTRAGAVAPAWQRETARFVDAAPDPFGSGQVYRYRLPAKLPVEQGRHPASARTTPRRGSWWTRSAAPPPNSRATRRAGCRSVRPCCSACARTGCASTTSRCCSACPMPRANGACAAR